MATRQRVIRLSSCPPIVTVPLPAPRGPGPATGLPAKISDAVTKLTHNLKEITAKLPDVDSYTVQAGFPFGVSVRYHQLLKRRDWRKLAAAAAPRTHALTTAVIVLLPVMAQTI